METTYLGSKRLVLQCSVLDPRQFQSNFSELSSERLKDLHLTVFHIGKSLDLFREISSQTGVELECYESFMVEYLRKSVARSRSSYSATGHSITDLVAGPTQYKVLAVHPEPQLTELRDFCRRGFVELLIRCGVDDPEEFIIGSPIIEQHSPRWTPHITLDARPLTSAASPPPWLPLEVRSLSIELGRLHVRRS